MFEEKEKINRCGISYKQYRCMQILEDIDAASIATIARAMRIKQDEALVILGELQKMELVVEHKDQAGMYKLNLIGKSALDYFYWAFCYDAFYQ